MVNPILQFFLWNGWFLKYYLCVIKDLQKNQLHSGTCKHLQFHHNWDTGVFLRKMSGEASTLPLLRLFPPLSLSLSSRSRVVQLARILRSSFTSGLWLIFLLAALSLSLSLSLSLCLSSCLGGRATLCGNVPPHPPPSRVYFANAKNVLFNSYQLPYSFSEKRLFKWNFEFHNLLFVTFLHLHNQCHESNWRGG